MGSCLSAESTNTRSPLASSSPVSPAWGGARRRKRKSSSSSRREDPALHRIPGRFFLNGSTHVASLYSQQGKKGTNQDAMIVWENFGSRSDTIFCGVFDGHGPYGHMVAKRVRDSLPLRLTSNWELNVNSEEVLKEISPNTAGTLNSADAAFPSVDEDFRAASVDGEGSEKHPEIFHTLKESFLKAFKVMDRELRIQPSIDCFCSGTTAVTLIKQGRDIILGNVGDSRAVLCTRDKDDALLAIQLTVDLKPNLPAEAERIRKYRGRVFSLHDEPEVCRVWLPNNDSPGLAMARAFGDFCLKDFGLISVPDVSYRHLSEKDQFIVLATDGIWDVLSNKEVVDIIASAPARSSSARVLVESAVRAWRQKYPTSKVDDCAVVCLYLDSEENNLSTAANNNLSKQHTAVDDLNAGSENQDVSGPTSFVRTGTARNGEEILEDKEDTEEEGSKENATEDHNSESGIDWSALEGVSRVNTLLTLPRFVLGKEDIEARKKAIRLYAVESIGPQPCEAPLCLTDIVPPQLRADPNKLVSRARMLIRGIQNPLPSHSAEVTTNPPPPLSPPRHTGDPNASDEHTTTLQQTMSSLQEKHEALQTTLDVLARGQANMAQQFSAFQNFMMSQAATATTAGTQGTTPPFETTPSLRSFSAGQFSPAPSHFQAGPSSSPNQQVRVLALDSPNTPPSFGHFTTTQTSLPSQNTTKNSIEASFCDSIPHHVTL